MENNSEYQNSFIVIDIQHINKTLTKNTQIENDSQAICTTHEHNEHINSNDSFQWLLNLPLLFYSFSSSKPEEKCTTES